MNKWCTGTFFVSFLYQLWVSIFDWLIRTGSHMSSKQKMITLIGVSENYWEINLDADFRMGQAAVGRLWNIIHSQLSLYILKLNYYILVYTHQVDWFDFTNNFEEACWCGFLYLVFIHRLGESSSRWLRPLLFSCDILWALINSLCWVCRMCLHILIYTIKLNPVKFKFLSLLNGHS